MLTEAANDAVLLRKQEPSAARSLVYALASCLRRNT